MKKITLCLVAIFVISFAMAQGTINFAVANCVGDELSPKGKAILKLRVEQIITRNNASASMPKNAFVIEPQLVVDDVMQSEGLLQNISYTKAELTLIAKNVVDKSLYYSIVIPLEAKTTGDKEKLIKRLIKSIKVTDVRYTRFIRNARVNITKYFMKNCAAIMQQAQTMYALGQYEKALTYLSAMPPTVSCNEQASQLIEQIIQAMPKEMSPAPVVVPDTVSLPSSQPKPKVVISNEANKPICKLTISDPTIEAKVIAAVGNLVNKNIIIELELKNISSQRKGESVRFETAISPKGKEFSSLTYNGRRYLKTPYNVLVQKQFVIQNVFSSIDKLAYVEVKLGKCIISIKDLNLTWK